MNKNRKSIGIMSVATNIYINYWKDMIVSLDAVIDDSATVVSHIFTDQPEEAKQIGSVLKLVKLKIHEIPPYVWPEATLLRYKVFLSASESMNEDILMHLDADMLVHKNLVPEVLGCCLKNDVTLVSHPGYWRKKFDLSSPSELYSFIRDRPRLKSLIRRSPLGSWENDKRSMAFVPEKHRKNYVCGGTWFGKGPQILDLLHELSDLTDIDISNGITPIWHDESMLNRWASKNTYGIHPPSLCYVDEYKYLESLPRIIQAVTKNDKTR
jgi:hypothetical protein